MNIEDIEDWIYDLENILKSLLEIQKHFVIKEIN